MLEPGMKVENFAARDEGGVKSFMYTIYVHCTYNMHAVFTLVPALANLCYAFFMAVYQRQPEVHRGF